MDVNIVAMSGKLSGGMLEMYTRSGKRMKVVKLFISEKSCFDVIFPEGIFIDAREVIIFGKLVNLNGKVMIYALEAKEPSKL